MRKRREGSGCIQSLEPPNEYGNIEISSNVMYFNTTIMLDTDYPAFIMFAAVVHEAHHVSAPLVDLPQPEPIFDIGLNRTVEGVKKRGFSLLALDTNFAKPNQACYNTYRIQLEEAVVENSTERMTQKLDFIAHPSAEYARWVSNYQREIVDKLFGGNHTIPLRYHQSSQDIEFFQDVGRKIPGIPPGTITKAGDEASFRAIVLGLPVI